MNLLIISIIHLTLLLLLIKCELLNPDPLSIISNGLSNTGPAIGKPWDSSVHIYYTPTPKISTSSPTSSNSSSNTNSSFNKFPQNTKWTPLQIISDRNNGTFPNRGPSLFGYTLSLSKNGKWLAIGVPGRTYIPSGQNEKLENHEYAGAVVIYKILGGMSGIPSSGGSAGGNSGGGSAGGKGFEYIGEIPNLNSVRFWNKFGSKVHFESILQPITTTTTSNSNTTSNNTTTRNTKERLFLFISTNGGWDGSTTKWYQAPLPSPAYPIQPTHYTQYNAVYLYECRNPELSVVTGGPILMPETGSFVYLGKVGGVGSIPLAGVALEFSVWSDYYLWKYNSDATSKTDSTGSTGSSDSSSSSGSSTTNEGAVMKLYIRDYVINDKQFLKQCMYGQNCTYDTTGEYSPSGVVLEYHYDFTLDQFVLVTTDDSSSSSSSSTDSTSSNGNSNGNTLFPISPLNADLQTYFPPNLLTLQKSIVTDWRRSDYFGIGIATGYDYLYDRMVVAVGSPRGSIGGVYTYSTSMNAVSGATSGSMNAVSMNAVSGGSDSNGGSSSLGAGSDSNTGSSGGTAGSMNAGQIIINPAQYGDRNTFFGQRVLFGHPISPFTTTYTSNNTPSITNTTTTNNTFFNTTTNTSNDTYNSTNSNTRYYLSPQQYLLVNDASGTQSDTNGHLYVYKQRSIRTRGLLYPDFLNDLDTSSSSIGSAGGSGNVPLGYAGQWYDLIMDLYINGTGSDASGSSSGGAGSSTSTSSMENDYFGFSVVSNPYFLVVGAPLKDSVYIYQNPSSQPLPSLTTQPPPPNQPPQPNPTTNTNTNSEDNGQPMNYNVLIGGLLGGLIGLLLSIVICWFMIKNRHRRKLLRKLKEEGTASTSKEVLGSEEVLSSHDALMSEVDRKGI